MSYESTSSLKQSASGASISSGLDSSLLSEQLGFDSRDHKQLERAIFSAVNVEDEETLSAIFEALPLSTSVLQIILTIEHPNRDKFYHFDEDIVTEAENLLGPRYIF